MEDVRQVLQGAIQVVHVKVELLEYVPEGHEVELKQELL